MAPPAGRITERAKKSARLAIILALAFFPILPQVQNAKATIPSFGYSRKWGSMGGPSAPNMVALDASGNVYVTDNQNLAVGKMSQDGTLLSLWGGPSQFSNPFGIAVDNARNAVFVTDSVKNTVYKYSTSGTLLASWNSNGTSNGKFVTPQGIAVNATGYVYVVDQGNRRLGIFQNDGTFVKYFQLGSPGTFLSAVGIAIDPQGFLYVDDDNLSSNDIYAGNITKFTKNGDFVTTWGATTGPSLLGPQGLSVDNASNIYVVDNFLDRIQEYNTATQKLVQSWGCSGTLPTQLRSPVGVAVNTEGNVFVSDPVSFKVLKFAGTSGCGTLGTPSVLAYQQTGKFSNPSDIAFDGRGSVYVADTSNDRVQKFNSTTGAFLGAWGTYGNQTGQFDGPSGIAIDRTGSVFVTDSNNNRVQKFLANGTFIGSWGTLGNCAVSCQNGQFYYPIGIAIDSSNNVYVADYYNNRVQKFDSSGTFIIKWGSSGSSNGLFNGPVGIASDPSNNIYVSDSSNNRIEEFNGSGGFLAAWGTTGSGTNQFNLPWGISLDTAGDIYVTDSGNNRVQVFYGNHTFLATFGTTGQGDGQLSLPQGLEVDLLDNVYVTDGFNNRIEVFAPLHDLALPKLTISRNNSYYNFPLVNPISINITIANSGLSNETFSLTEYANSTIIGQQNLALAAGQSLIAPFSWSPTLIRGTYNITAQVQLIQGDPNPTNNIAQGGLFYIRLKGDVNGDCKVNIIDLSQVGLAFTSKAGPPASSNWNPYADLNNDRTVNILDLVAVASNFNQIC